jgi:ketosteroid isomerase-like protein
MGAQENLAVAREVQDAFARGDFQRLDELTADDVIWHEIGKSEPLRGKAALQGEAPGQVDYEITAKTHDILASDDHAITLVEATATRGGRSLTYRTAEIYHIRNGQIAERWSFSDDTDRITRFFA